MEATAEKKVEMISIPRGSCFRFTLFLASIVLAYFGIKLIGFFLNEYGISINSPYETEKLGLKALIIYPWWIFGYIIMSLPSICFIAWVKKGFRNLKPPKLIDSPFNGFIGHSVVALAISLVGGLTFAFISRSMIVPIVLVTPIFLFFGLAYSFIFGLISEFGKS
jgi:hypothetical protein